jgi:hypothetical protein
MSKSLLKIEPPGEPMPPTVVVVVCLIGFFMLVDLLDAVAKHAPVRGAFGLAIAALILVGLVRRHALAWQWGVLMPLLASLEALATLGTARDQVMMVAASIALAIDLGIPLLLTRASARRYFGLICPRCKSQRIGATDFLFNGYRCKGCQVEWRHEEEPQTASQGG